MYYGFSNQVYDKISLWENKNNIFSSNIIYMYSMWGCFNVKGFKVHFQFDTIGIKADQ